MSRYRLITLALSLLLLFSSFGQQSAHPTNSSTEAFALEEKALAPELVAEAAILIDAKTGRVLYEKNADQKKYPASTTKIMTCLLAVERGDLNRTITVPDSAEDIPADSTRVPVYPGEKMKFLDLIYGLMIKSGNDAANAIAEIVSGSTSDFVRLMNARAKELGMSGTRFQNAHGYPDERHYSTARDLAILTRAALQNEDFEKIVRTKRYVMGATARRDARSLQNGYAILDSDSPYYDDRAFGIKTGYSIASGQCFVCAAEKDGTTLISVVLKSGLQKPEKWTDTKKLFDYGFLVD